ncbi:uncharacterized protein K02A2.6-like [Ylistrum balloti]|uniref:uncharacterized protein K02A2.6-like n=1 Tax=Ylistrum balloti TaxID=509963 RepID=UPI002905A9EC|nr:uncharacterized protein K02A2.6-like [Ylistrum balloti]
MRWSVPVMRVRLRGNAPGGTPSLLVVAYFSVAACPHRLCRERQDILSCGCGQSLFSSYGLPEEVVSDNSPQFTSTDFEQFMKRNGVNHTLVTPYHPASNGAAERSVQILKQSLQKHVFDGNEQYTIQHRLSNFLLKYRSTPTTVTGVSPAELFLQRQLRTPISLLKPDTGSRVQRKQAEHKRQHDKGRVRVRTFSPKQTVRVRNFRGGQEKWIPGTIVRQLSPLTYLVRAGPNIRYTHVDHIFASGEELLSDDLPVVSQVDTPVVLPETLSRSPILSKEPETPKVPISVPDTSAVVAPFPAPRLEPSTSNIHSTQEPSAPQKLNLFVGC